MNRRASRAFTLRAWIAVIALIAFLVLIAIPIVANNRNAMRTRMCRENLARIVAAKEQYAVTHQAADGTTVTLETLVAEDNILEQLPVCLSGGSYSVNPINVTPTCSHGEGHAIKINPRP